MKNFLIYKSSAGSGKTYTLVKEYLKIVLSNPADFRQTLAITFTNKAAEEMKIRVIQKLAELAEGKDPELEKTLISEGVKANIGLTAAQVLSQILHKYSYLSISTIDSFFHKVIRAFSRELKLQLGYNVEMKVEQVLEKIVDEVFDKIGGDAENTSLGGEMPGRTPGESGRVRDRSVLLGDQFHLLDVAAEASLLCDLLL